MESILVLADGRVFSGRGFGATQGAVGEVVFNTSMTGYQEILTDPSYRGQLVVLTQPLIGNYGVNPDDAENREGKIWPSGLIVRETTERYSNHRAVGSLPAYLREHGVPGIQDLDTRALTRHLRDRGAMVGAIAAADRPRESVLKEIHDWGSMEGRQLVDEVCCREPYTLAAAGKERLRMAVYDYGCKKSILESLSQLGVTLEVFPAGASPQELLACEPDGILLTNGPGDPAACTEAISNVRALMGKQPVFGICLGHQLLALALGAETYKLPFGHHGGNHPVQEVATGRVEITSQNHGFAVDEASLVQCGAMVTHINLNDRSVEGFSVPRLKTFAVQYHPEAAPGPHDAHHLFDWIVRLLERN